MDYHRGYHVAAVGNVGRPPSALATASIRLLCRLRLRPHRQHERHMPRMRNAHSAGRQPGGVMRRLGWPMHAVSLLLSIAMALLWIRSCCRSDALTVAWGPQQVAGGRGAGGVTWMRLIIHPVFTVKSESGRLQIGTTWGDWLRPGRKIQMMRRTEKVDRLRPLPMCRFETSPRLTRSPYVPMFALMLPDVAPMFAFLIFSLLWWMRARSGRHRHGFDPGNVQGKAIHADVHAR